jgi:NADP-dependent aldehyde dehydrogenase
MTLKGVNFIGFLEGSENVKSFKAFDPQQNQYLSEEFKYASDKELERALDLATNAFQSFRLMSASKRADFLDAIAEEIMNEGDGLLKRCSMETGLPEARIMGERARTCGQLNLFASLLRDGWYVDARIDTAQPERTPVPKPDIRRMLIPIGPVAVFGSSNFPLAFSTAGGDTASALAAGCPVIVKAHSSHPGTNEIVAGAIIRAAKRTNMPEGVFSSVYLSHEKVMDLAKHAAIKAIGFTGSRKVGMMLFNAAAQREEPIPVYAEMSAVNPVIILENALKERSEKIASGLVDSVTLGVGQFCTNPGIVLLRNGAATDKFFQQVTDSISKANPGTMLNRNICKSYAEGIAAMQKEESVRIVGHASKEATDEKNEARPVLFAVNANDFIANPVLSQEIFGPASLTVTYSKNEELYEILRSMEGQLTATIHAGEADKSELEPIINIITQKAGRVIFGGFPTGVEVCHSMQHGGPFPSTTDGRSTSVGTAAIYRFLRPVAYQNFPDHILPEALQNANPLSILRLINGKWSTEGV